MSSVFNELMAVFTLETHNPSLRIVYLGNYPPPWGKGTKGSTFGSQIARDVLQVLEALTWKRGERLLLHCIHH